MADLTPPHSGAGDFDDAARAARELRREAEARAVGAERAGAAAESEVAGATEAERRIARERRRIERLLDQAERRLAQYETGARRAPSQGTLGGIRRTVERHRAALARLDRPAPAPVPAPAQRIGGAGDLTPPAYGNAGEFEAAAEAANLRRNAEDLLRRHDRYVQEAGRPTDPAVQAAQAAAERARRAPARPTVVQGQPAAAAAERAGQAAEQQQRRAGAAAQDEERATAAIGQKADAARSATEWLRRQNEALEAAGPASAGEERAGRAVTAKADAAERATAALREQNTQLRAQEAAQAARPARTAVAQGGAAPADVDARVARQAENAEIRQLADAQRQREVNATDAARGISAAAASDDRFTRALTYQSVALESNSNSWRRHGALTTEFIEAARRGEASYREWGFQIASTAGKFAGWTAVSIPVFAALDGVRQLGQGAIDSASGVNQISRAIDNVDADVAQADFRRLASQFNVPIADVVSAVEGMGQVFHNQRDAVDAATVALYANRTGGVDVADATKQLTAVVNGANLPASQLGIIFDQLNQAQNDFGATIPDTLGGLAKAAGAFHNAGGSVDYLIGLIVTAQRVTGVGGQQIGTALARSADFLQRPSNREALRSFGIDTSGSVEDIINQAFEVAPTLTGERLNELASAIASPQWARIWTPLLQNGDRFNTILADTSPERAKGSANRELQRILGSVSEQIQRIGVELQNLGSNLAQAGVLTGFGLVLRAVTETLHLANNLLEVFNQLPAPVRQLVSGLVEARAAMAVMRRFEIGGALEQTRFQGLAPLLQSSPERYTRRQAQSAMRAETKALQEEQETLRKGALRAASEVNIAVARRDRVAREVGPIENYPEGVDRDVAQAKVAAASRRAEESIEKYADAHARAEEQLALQGTFQQRNERIRERERAGVPWRTIAREEIGYVAPVPGQRTGLAPVGTEFLGPRSVEGYRASGLAEASRRADQLRGQPVPAFAAAALAAERVRLGAFQEQRALEEMAARSTFGPALERLGAARDTAARRLSADARRMRDATLRGGMRFSSAIVESIGFLAQIPRGMYEDYRTSTDLLNRGTAGDTIDEREEARRQLAQRRARGADVRRAFGLTAGIRNVASDVALNAMLRNQSIAGSTIDQRELARHTLAQREAAGQTFRGAVGRTQVVQRIGQGANALRDFARSGPVLRASLVAFNASQLLAARAVIGVGPAIAAAAGRMRAMGAAMLSAIGPMELLLLAAIGISVAAEKFKNQQSRVDAQLERASSPAHSQRQADAQLRDARAAAGHRRDFHDVLTDIGNLTPWWEDQADDVTRARGRAAINAHNAEQRRRGLAIANTADAVGDPRRFGADLYAEDIRNIAISNKALLEQGRITPEEFRRRMQYLIGAARISDQSQAGRDTQVRNIRSDMLTRATGANYYRDLADQLGAGLPVDELQSQQQGLSALIQLGDASEQTLNHFAANAVALAAQFRGSTTAEGRQAYAQARQSYEDIEQGAQNQLQRELGIARGQEERNRAYDRYQQRINAPLAGPRALLRQLDRQRRDVQRQLQTDDLPDPRVDPQAYRTAVQARDPLRQRLRDIDRRRRALRGEIDNYEQENADALREMREQRFQEAEAYREAVAGTTAARADAGAPRIAVQLRDQARKLAAYIRHYGRDSKEVEGVIQEGISLRDQATQETLSLMQARAGIGIAQARTPAAQGRLQLAQLRQQLAFQRAHPRTYSRSDVAGTEQAIAQQIESNRQQTNQDAIAQINAHYDFIEAVIDPGDTVRIAQLEAQRARALEARGADTPQEREQLAGNRRRADAELARTRQQDRFDEIEFLASVGQMSRSAEVQGLRRLERTVHNNRQLRRQIQQRIYELTHQDEQQNELTIGNVRVPSLYEVRRAVAGGSRNLTNVNQNRVEVHVHGPQDYDALGRVLETHVSGTGRSLARAGGQR